MRNKKIWASILAGFLAFVMLFGLIAGILPTLAGAENLSTLKEQLKELEQDNKDIEAQLKELRDKQKDNLNEMSDIVNQKNLIDQEIALLHQQVTTINEQISAYSLLIADKQEELEQVEARLAELNAQNKARIRAMEENGTPSYWSVLFRANSFADFLDRMQMILEIQEADKRRLKEMDEAAELVAKTKEDLEEEKEGLRKTKEDLNVAQESLLVKREQADELLTQLIATGAEYQQLIEESEDKQNTLMEEIAQKKDDIKDAEYKQWLSTSIPKPVAGDTNTVEGVTWVMPISYTALTSPFGYRIHPISGKWKMHNGVDLAAPTGTKIVATRSGYVSVASYEEGGAGWYVQINHGDGYKSIYMHMTHYIVKVGQYVSAGEVIGYCGTSGGSTGPHLHFGISYNGVYQNPAKYIPI